MRVCVERRSSLRWSAMSTTGMAIFVFVGFLLPVPILHWLDRAAHEPSAGSDQDPA